MSTCWSGEPDYVERLEAENERLRLKLGQAEKIAKLLPESAAEIERLRAAYDRLCKGTPAFRASIIEECARVAESFIGTLIITGPQDIAAAIRALKDKP